MPILRRDRRRAKRGHDRRQATRLSEQRTVQVSASVAIFDAETVLNGTARPVTLTGYTRDISPAGLSVVVPSANIDERYCSQHHSLQMMIDLPNKPLEVEATIIHCKPLDKFDAAKGYLIGAQIAQSSSEKAAALANHLSRLTELD